jgi:hypothetical protein
MILRLLSTFVAALLLIGSTTRGQDMNTDTYLFIDRTDPKDEYAFVLRGDAVFLQVAVFPGYSDRRWYAVDKVQIKDREEWLKRPGDKQPPFPPPGPLLTRLQLGPKDEGKRAYFSERNAKLQEWLASLKKTIAVETARTQKLPAWVDSDQRLKKLLGM